MRYLHLALAAAYGLCASTSLLAKDGAGTRLYVFSPDRPASKPQVVQPGGAAKAKIPSVPLFQVPLHGTAPSHPVILDKASPKD